MLLLDLDDSLTAQPVLAGLLRDGRALRIEARDLASRLRIVAARKPLKQLRERLHEAVGAENAPGTIAFYGSGDFHHLATLFLARLREEVTLLHFDNHPDWVRFPATVNCGAWVNLALELPQVAQIVTIGPAGEDLVRPQWKGANLHALREGRLEVHAWRGSESRYWGHPFVVPGCRAGGGRIAWDSLADASWDGFLEALDARLPGRPLWVSLDKDVLGPDEALTNWEQGGMALSAILGTVQRLGRRRGLLGIDVCGDYSPPRFHDPFRWLLSVTDRAAVPRPSEAALAVNDRSNRRILEAFGALSGTADILPFPSERLAVAQGSSA
ncbi:MAG: hypothetical protein DI601_07980 [Azospirillum brasilense]|nr:MAG: hypothetical protein DI601_07980 [Azospirillum brasilense]